MNQTAILKNQKFHIIIAYVVFTLLVSIYHLFIINTAGDGPEYFVNFCDTNIFDYSWFRYQTWTSRLIIEAFIILLCNKLILWKIINIIIIVSIVFALNKIIFKEANILNTIETMLFYLLIPLTIPRSAGYVVTFINNYWVVAAMLFTFLPVVMYIRKQKFSVIYLIIGFLFSFYACNLEQCCYIVFVFLLFSSIYYFIKNKKFNIYMVLIMLICILSLVFIFYTPGNHLRLLQEIGNWMPMFQNLTLLQKLYIGFMVCMSSLYKCFGLLFVYGLICLVACFKQHLNWKIKFFSLIYMLLIFGLGTYYVCYKIWGLQSLMFDFSSVYFRVDNLIIENQLLINTSFVLNVVVFIFTLIIPILIYKKLYKVILFILLLGFSSKMLLAFSPTVIASGDRTSIFFFLSIVSSCLLFCKVFNWKHDRNSLIFILCVACLFVAVNIFVFVSMPLI